MSQGQQRRTAGPTGTQVAYQWVNYVPGRTGFQATQNDALTGHMSGCWIFTWVDGARKVGHLGTIDTAPPNLPPNSVVKDVFWQVLNNPGFVVPPPHVGPRKVLPQPPIPATNHTILGYQPHLSFPT